MHTSTEVDLFYLCILLLTFPILFSLVPPWEVQRSLWLRMGRDGVEALGLTGLARWGCAGQSREKSAFSKRALGTWLPEDDPFLDGADAPMSYGVGKIGQEPECNTACWDNMPSGLVSKTFFVCLDHVSTLTSRGEDERNSQVFVTAK